MKIKIKPEWAELIGFNEADFEIAYWRKCWHFRADVLEYFDATDDDEFRFPMVIEDFDGINKIISKHIVNKTAEMIWDKKEMKSIHKSNRRFLQDCILLNTYGGDIAVAKYVIDVNIDEGFDKAKGEILKDLDLDEIIESIEFYFYDSY